MTTTQAFGAALIGQPEKALNTILERHLAGTGITEPQSVAERIAELTTAGLLRDGGTAAPRHARRGRPGGRRSATSSARSSRGSGATCPLRTLVRAVDQAKSFEKAHN
ncbi:hypothetical protein [Nonomuraea turkmeniaca]|uniref:hypothetical protein n=1 Tax=Nonomuraea turkmeniaca TaxID=103838 RepID=UPI001B878CA1|nr:hypothetical protein [Nonomuraea turkmeniaca]